MKIVRKVIVAETPYQIIVAMVIKKQYSNKDDKVDLIITDTFNGYTKVKENINKIAIFNNVYIAEIRNSIVNKSITSTLKKIAYVFNLKKMIVDTLDNIGIYDEMYCWNYDVFTSNLRSYFVLKNKNLKFFIYDEGYISYFPMDEVMPNKGFSKIIEYRNKIIGLSHIIRKNIDGILLFEPNLLIYKPKCEILTLDRNIFYSNEFKKIIQNIFDTSKVAKNYNKKIIIFEEAMFSNSNEFDDEKVILNIVNKVGKENVLIKLHPRTKEDRFSKLGIKTLGNDGIPWEAITLTSDFSNKVLIAISSGSIVNYRLTYGKNMRAIMMFKLFKTNLRQLSNDYDVFWNKLKSNYPDGGIYIPESIEELDKILTEIGSDEK